MRVESLALPTRLGGNWRLGRGPDVVAPILVGVAYFALAYLGLRLASINPSVTPIWPPTGLAIAAILLWGNRIALAIFIGAFLVNQLTAGSILTSLAIASGNTLEAVVAGYLIRLWGEGEQVFDTPNGVIKFALISLVATMVSATIGVSSLTLAGYAEVGSFTSVWLTWWFGDLAGALVIAPVVVLWAKTELESLTRPQVVRTGLTYLAAVAVGVMAFTPLLQQTTLHDALVFVVVLPLLWAALRQGPRDTATVALIVSAFVVWCTVLQCGPFAKPSLNDSFILALAFIISTAVLSLALSTDVAVRGRIENEQRQRGLETEVLWQATARVAFGGSFEDLLRGCLESICRVTGWPAAHVYLPDDVNNPRRLLPSPVWHFEREDLTPLARETAGAVLEIGERLPCKSESLRSESAHEQKIPILLKGRKRGLLKHGLHAAFGFPLYAEGKLQAVLEFFSDTPHPPDEHLIQVVQSIGQQLGRLLERRQGQEQQRQAVALAKALNLTTIRSEALEATLDALNSGVYLADRDGRIVYMNREAKRQADTGNVVRVTNGRLAPIDHKARLTLTRAVDEAIGVESDLLTSGSTIALPAENNAGLIATILPLACGEHASSHSGIAGMAAIFVQDPIIIPPLAGEAFAVLYGLTTSELRVLLAMAPGLSAKEAAETLAISESTAKTHLKHIHSKTGTSKQTELIRLFMSAIPPVSRGDRT
jgi:integral membrane sensor domain MASE1/DNA-binding CsgD family transcriptional regulator